VVVVEEAEGVAGLVPVVAVAPPLESQRDTSPAVVLALYLQLFDSIHPP
jgi:hypothetical protein